MRTASRWTFAALVLAFAPSFALAQDKPDGKTETLSDSWVLLQVNGKRAGFAHELRVKRLENARAVIETSSSMHLVMQREGSRNEMQEDDVCVETEDGQALRFEKKSVFSARPAIYKGTIKDGKATLSISIGGSEQTRVIDWDKNALLDEGSRLLVFSKMKEKGAHFSCTTFSTSKLDCSPTEYTVVGADTIEMAGKKIETTKVHSSHEGQEQDNWIDAAGFTRRAELDMGGLVIRMELSTQAEVESPETQDGVWTLAMYNRADTPLPHARALESMVVRVERPSGGLDKWEVPATTQAVIARDDHSVTLRVTRHAPAQGAKLPIAVTPELAPLLTPEPFIQSDEPVLVAKAKELRGSETDSLKVARAIAGFVGKHIAKKDYDTGYASAKEAYESKTGDCTEHAVLLVALLRAAGIPSQLAGGFIGLPSGSFGGHAWASAWVGEWIDLDATLGDEVADAARIKLEEGRSDRKKKDGPLLGMSKLVFHVSELTAAGKTTAVKPLVVEPGRFEASALGISFTLDPTKVWILKSIEEAGKHLAVVSDGKTNEIAIDYEELPAKVGALKLEAAYTEILGKPIKGTTSELAGHEVLEVGNEATGAVVIIRLNRTDVLQLIFKGKRGRKGYAAITEALQLPK